MAVASLVANARDGHFAEELFASGGILALTNLLSSAKDNNRLYAASALAKLVGLSVNCRVASVNDGAVPRLVGMLASKNVPLVQQALLALSMYPCKTPCVTCACALTRPSQRC